MLAKEFDIRKQSYLEKIYGLLEECHMKCIVLPLNTLQILLKSKFSMAISILFFAFNISVENPSHFIVLRFWYCIIITSNSKFTFHFILRNRINYVLGDDALIS